MNAVTNQFNLNSDNSELGFEKHDPATVIKALEQMEYTNNQEIWKHFMFNSNLKKFKLNSYLTYASFDGLLNCFTAC